MPYYMHLQHGLNHIEHIAFTAAAYKMGLELGEIVIKNNRKTVFKMPKKHLMFDTGCHQKINNGVYKGSVGLVIGLSLPTDEWTLPKVHIKFLDTTVIRVLDTWTNDPLTNYQKQPKIIPEARKESIVKNKFKHEIEKDRYGIIFRIPLETQNCAKIISVFNDKKGIRIFYQMPDGTKSWTSKPNSIYIPDDQEIAKMEYAMETLKA